MMKFVIVSLVFLLSACASNQHVVQNPYSKADVAAKIYEHKSEFGEHRIYGPVIEVSYGNMVIVDDLSVQLMKTENDNYYLRVHNYYQKDWKYLESITTLDKETIPLQEVDRNVSICTQMACNHTEVGFAPLSKARHLTGMKDFKVRINGRRHGSMVVVLPKAYIKAFMERAG
jgi:hypothetical protein